MMGGEFAYKTVARHLLSFRRMSALSLDSAFRIVLPWPLYTVDRVKRLDSSNQLEQAQRYCSAHVKQIFISGNGQMITGYAIEDGDLKPFYVEIERHNAADTPKTTIVGAKIRRECLRLPAILLDLLEGSLPRNTTVALENVQDQVYCETVREMPQVDSWAVGLYLLDYLVKTGKNASRWPFNSRMEAGEGLEKKVKAGMSRHRVCELEYVQHCLGMAFYHAWSWESNREELYLADWK
jgi:hypothetical protein